MTAWSTLPFRRSAERTDGVASSDPSPERADKRPYRGLGTVPHNGRHHAVSPLDADRTPALGYAGTLRGHTIPGAGLTFRDHSPGITRTP